MALLGEIGTLAWTRRSKGILTRREQARFLAALAVAQTRAVPSMVAARLGRGDGPDPSEVTPPDSAICRETLAECRELLPESVVEHSLRSYMFAVALDQAVAAGSDPEQLFVGAMFHDWAITQIGELDDRCFTLPSAERVVSLCEDHGWDKGRAEVTAESVTMHINPEVPAEHGLVQHLVHDGVMLDILALRASELDRSGIRRTFQRHPRGDFMELGPGKLREHASRVPRCRVEAAFMGGFGIALKLAPGD